MGVYLVSYINRAVVIYFWYSVTNAIVHKHMLTLRNSEVMGISGFMLMYVSLSLEHRRYKIVG
jgi:hypothetical protein